jgi:hypothetical protein
VKPYQQKKNFEVESDGDMFDSEEDEDAIRQQEQPYETLS